MTNKPKNIGTKFETACVNMFNENDLPAHRIALSGSEDRGDVAVEMKDLTVVVECKSYKSWSRKHILTWRNQALREAENYCQAFKVKTTPVLIVNQYGKSNRDSYVHMIHNKVWVQMYLDEFIHDLKGEKCQ